VIIRKQRQPVEDAVEPVVQEAVGPQPGDPYQGDYRAIGFRDGFHYVVKFDTEGAELGLDLERPLVWDEAQKVYFHAHPNDANHFHRYGNNPVELVVL